MVALAFYFAVLGVACAFALVDWRRGWLLISVLGVLQDPVRKLVPGTPVWVSFLVVVLYAVVVFSARHEIVRDIGDFSTRFSRIYTVLITFIFLLGLAALNGVLTFGVKNWKVPMLSLITYLVPLMAAALGYTWLRREERMFQFLKLYAIVTSVALIGTMAEYYRIESRILGMVAFSGDYIRHLPGIQIRLLSGIYRGPDVMALHAATLASIGIAMALRSGLGRGTLVWGGVGIWGFINCMLGGRRKAIYFVLVFLLAFVWRYVRRVRVAEVLALGVVLVTLFLVVQNLSSNSKTSAYTAGAVTSEGEIRQRFEGGVFETLRQTGAMGVGLGAATQGVYHLVGAEMMASKNLGWQEGGLGKLAAELGLPGIGTLLLLSIVVVRMTMRLTAAPDLRGSSQFLRVLVFALVTANAASFIVSAQAYSDAVLGLTFGFFVGCLFATARLDEIVGDEPAESNRTELSPATA